MPSPEKAPFPPATGKARVSFHQKLRHCHRRAGCKIMSARQFGRISESPALPIFGSAPACRASFESMAVFQLPEPIRQTKRKRPKPCAQPVIQPLREEMNPRLFIVPHVRPDIEKAMTCHWPEEPRQRSSPEARTHAAHRK